MIFYIIIKYLIIHCASATNLYILFLLYVHRLCQKFTLFYGLSSSSMPFQPIKDSRITGTWPMGGRQSYCSIAKQNFSGVGLKMTSNALNFLYAFFTKK